MAAPGRKFSFSRLVSNMIPNFANDSKNDVDLSPQQADQLLAYQLASKYPRCLSENAFFIAGITGSESVSKKVNKALVKHGIILPVPEVSSSSGQAGTETMTVNTAGISKRFASQMAIISVHAQRKLVGLLFFWEEECMRWKLLDQEEREIIDALKVNERNADLECALEAVRMKMKMLPSKRGEETANVVKGAGHELPSYS
ncbi:hypothetical protein N431DRAFT_434147 [Stipitochalara longipes BDJ]|nr:hypothetical protein N431DRAFT_434147 [Stipitochalara longipes BDJ]